VCERLDRGCLDFGILLEPSDLKRYEYIQLPVTDRWGALMRKDSPLAASGAITPEQLAGLPLFCSKRELVEREFAAWMGDAYNRANILADYNLIHNVSLMVEEGLGYALCLEGAMHVTEDSPFRFRPLEPKMEAGVTVAWKKYQTFSRAAGAFLEMLRQETL